MNLPIFSDTAKKLFPRLLNGVRPNPTTPFVALAALELAVSPLAADDPAKEMVTA